MVKSKKQRLHLLKLNKKGKRHPAWKGGIRKGGKSFGYLREYCPTHPYCDNRGYVLQHRLIMERHLGRILLLTEVVHHINGNKEDNRIENLMLFSNHSKHHKYEWKIGSFDNRNKEKRKK